MLQEPLAHSLIKVLASAGDALEPGTVRRSTDFSAARPYLLALLTSALVGLLLRLRILHDYLIQRYTTDFFLDFIRNGLFAIYLLLLLTFLLVFGRLAAGPARRLISRVVMRWLAAWAG